MKYLSLSAAGLALALLTAPVQAASLTACGPHGFSLSEWPTTDFTRCTAPLAEIRSGGPGKDGIPAINNPVHIPVAEETTLSPNEPVISITIGNHARAYPLRYLIWHEIANDTIGGVPVAATYCPLCNAAIAFDRRVGETVLNFGTTGNLRKSDLVMYDRKTGSWWQQYTGIAIVGEYAGEKLKILPSKLESWGEFKERNAENGTAMGSETGYLRPYGANPYQGYDTSRLPFLYDGELPEGIAPLARVVVVGHDEDRAYALSFLREHKILTTKDGTRLEWKPGQNSALDTRNITQGRDVGTVTATKDGKDIVHKVTFAFVYHAFTPDGEIVQ